MKKCASSPNLVWGTFKIIGNMIHNIFRYLSCYECESSDNRTLLRKLYNAGYLEEGKYHQFRERCLDDSFDPEEIHNSSLTGSTGWTGYSDTKKKYPDNPVNPV